MPCGYLWARGIGCGCGGGVMDWGIKGKYQTNYKQKKRQQIEIGNQPVNMNIYKCDTLQISFL